MDAAERDRHRKAQRVTGRSNGAGLRRGMGKDNGDENTHSDLNAFVAKEVEISKDGEIHRGMLMGQVKDYCDDEPDDNRWIIYILDQKDTYVSEIRFTLNDGWKISLDDTRDLSQGAREPLTRTERGRSQAP